jgi:hypothetical protein
MPKDNKPSIYGCTVSDKVRDYSNEPAFIEQSKRARELMEKVGFPKGVPSLRKMN